MTSRTSTSPERPPEPDTDGEVRPDGGPAGEHAHEQPHSTALTFTYRTAARAETVARSVRLESGAIPGERTETTVAREDRTVTVRVAAADLAALRAGVFTWCGLVAAAEETATRVAN